MTDTPDKITQAGWRERLGDGEFFVNGDTFDLVFRPGGGSFASNDIVVGKMACGDTAFYLPQEIARLLNASTRPTISSPVAGELAELFALMNDQIELNPSNYDHDDACRLNTEALEIFEVASNLFPRILTALQGQPAVDDGEAVATLRELKRRTPDYMGEGAKPQHYQRIHRAYDAAIAALATHQGQRAAALDEARQEIRDLATDLAKYPCHNADKEDAATDLEVGCCGPCRARQTLSALKETEG